MDATRRRRTRDEVRRRWYGRWRQERFARSAFRPGTHKIIPCCDPLDLTVALLSREGEALLLLFSADLENGKGVAGKGDYGLATARIQNVFQKFADLQFD